MRINTILLSLLVSASLISCSKTGINGNEDVNNPEATRAFVSVQINAPSATRASAEDDDNEYGGVDNGTAAESAVSEVALLAFDTEYNFIGVYLDGTLKTGANGKPVYNCTISHSATRFFVVINYEASPEIKAAVEGMSGVGNVNNSLYKPVVADVDAIAAMATNGKFIMVNEGTFDESSSSSEAFVSLPDGEILSKDETKPTLVSIKVDRILSKFDFTVSEDLNTNSTNGYAEITGVKLNATNKSTFTYSEIRSVSHVTDQVAGNVIDYRTDPNMDLDATTAKDALNWLLNDQDEDKFIPVAGPCEYVLENTAISSRFNYNNLTQAVVQAVYTPDNAGVGSGESWFSVRISYNNLGQCVMSFATLQDYYNGKLESKYGTMSEDSKTAYNKQLNHILSFSDDADVVTKATSGAGYTWADDVFDLLEAVEIGGYRAATAPDGYYVKYYQNSINYYDVFIQHNGEVEIGYPGRWGMVRNNYYNLAINSILKPGLPYIPSPFDDKITDPDNPNPEDPEPADELDGFIDAEIDVNPWTVWNQSVDLQ